MCCPNPCIDSKTPIPSATRPAGTWCCSASQSEHCPGKASQKTHIPQGHTLSLELAHIQGWSRWREQSEKPSSLDARKDNSAEPSLLMRVPWGISWIFYLTLSFPQSDFLHSPTSTDWRTPSSKPPAHKLSQSLLPEESTLRHVLIPWLSMIVPCDKNWFRNGHMTQIKLIWTEGIWFWDILGNFLTTRENHRKRSLPFQTKPE